MGNNKKIKGKAVEFNMHYTPSVKAVTTIYLRTEDRIEDTVVIVWEELAEICSKQLVEDDIIYVAGYWKSRSWKTHAGEEKKRWEFIAQKIWKMDGTDPVDLDIYREIPARKED